MGDAAEPAGQLSAIAKGRGEGEEPREGVETTKAEERPFEPRPAASVSEEV